MRVIILSITKFWQVVDAGISIYDDDDLGKRGRDEKKERRERGRDGERRRDDREGGRREERRGRLDFPSSRVAPHSLFFRDERDDKYARDRHRDRDEREDRYREDRYAREDRGRDEKQVGIV